MSQKAETELLQHLLTEMVQTEESAREHPRKEAARFVAGDPPAVAMLAVAEHAERALPALERLTGPPSRGLGKAIGSTFSAVRDLLGDRLISREKSYRGTLLGLHHGIDCALLTQAVAWACGRTDVVAFCTDWVDQRRPLVARCQREMTWFAAHPDLAAQKAG
jgi:hypothetical protein